MWVLTQHSLNETKRLQLKNILIQFTRKVQLRSIQTVKVWWVQVAAAWTQRRNTSALTPSSLVNISTQSKPALKWTALRHPKSSAVIDEISETSILDSFKPRNLLLPDLRLSLSRGLRLSLGPETLLNFLCEILNRKWWFDSAGDGRPVVSLGGPRGTTQLVRSNCSAKERGKKRTGAEGRDFSNPDGCHAVFLVHRRCGGQVLWNIK